MIPYEKEECLYTVTVTCEEEMLWDSVVFALKKPFVSRHLSEAQEYSEMLSSINPQATYKVMKMEEVK